MDEAAILHDLQGMIRDIFGRDDIAVTMATTARDIAGWDSFKQVELIIAAETRFGIQARSRELDRLRNVGDLVVLIAKKTSETQPKA